MKCPVCKNLMIVVESEKIELDHCVSCGGVWFDSGELALFLDTAKLDGLTFAPANILALPEATTSEKKRKCPICATKMKKTHIGQEPKVLIDACINGDGLWSADGAV